MKVLKYLIFLVTINLVPNLYSQEITEEQFPTDFGTYSIPLGSKVVLELKELDENNYEYRILSLEAYEGYYSFDNPPELFNNENLENTVELFFVGAYYNEGKEDGDYKTVLILRNNLSNPIKYDADIKYYYSEEFEKTSIVGAFPSVKTTEIWQHKIDLIALYNFSKYKVE
jgi:hypothetical protein